MWLPYVKVYRLLTRGTYESALYEKANFKLGLEEAIIGRGEYTVSAAPAETTHRGKQQQAAEVEELLRNGAQRLFTAEHDQAVP